MTDSKRVSALSAVSEINVTPLVDVLLVLLIIFMVVVPLAPRGLDTALPPPASGATEPTPVLVVTVDRTGLALNTQPVPTLEDLAARLSDALAGRTDRTVFVRAAGVVPYGGVVEVMDVAKGAGASRIGIMSSLP
jgi:biopolymer transport protein TolR